jgi:hypothetical protein
MANATNIATTDRREKAALAATTPMSFVAPVAAWLVPGLGHLIQLRRIRGLIIMACVVIMFFVGLAMH